MPVVGSELPEPEKRSQYLGLQQAQRVVGEQLSHEAMSEGSRQMARWLQGIVRFHPASEYEEAVPVASAEEHVVRCDLPCPASQV
jgi:hypothetical protein